MFQPRPWFLAAMVLYTISMRLTPYVLSHFGLNIDPETTIYPWNFSPLMAICLYGAAHFKSRHWAFLVPLGSLFISDLGIWALTGRLDWAFYPNQIFVYACFALSIGTGMWLRGKRSVLKVGGTALLAESVFFLVTNFGVWALGTTYAHTPEGLMVCYVAAIPFFGRSLMSTAMFTSLLFSPLAVVEREASVVQSIPVTAPVTD